ncbi:cellulose biosynthesis protein BcsQ [Pseudomonas gessardii]|uniref:cellulose biosynthesis protein BcsQ n=1 Tax=Pseudomonas gessardii TaxID=78544 RepID=UPI003B96955D
MSQDDEVFAKKTASHDRPMTSTLQFFEDTPIDAASSPAEQPQPTVMPACRAQVVVLASVNGGVGRSTLATALGSGLQRLGRPVTVLELDPQNALHLHFGLPHDALGIGRASLGNQAWDHLAQPGFCGCRVLVFGETDRQQQEDLQRWLKQDPDWLAQHLSHLGLSEQHSVIIDTPAGNNVYLHQALNAANTVVIVALADAASLGALEPMQRLLAPYLARPSVLRCHVLVNQLDEGSAFSLDMLDAFKRRLGEDGMDVIHRDPLISEALAFADDPLDCGAVSMACEDIHGLCRRLDGT